MKKYYLPVIEFESREEMFNYKPHMKKGLLAISNDSLAVNIFDGEKYIWNYFGKDDIKDVLVGDNEIIEKLELKLLVEERLNEERFKVNLKDL